MLLLPLKSCVLLLLVLHAAVGAESAWTLVLKQAERACPHRLNAYPLFAQSYQAFFN